MRVLVCGSRHFKNKEMLNEVLDKLGVVSTVIQGEARGADTLARQWAETSGIRVLGFPADWNLYGKSAGAIRNKRMLDEGQPDQVIAFMFKGSRGTKNMVEQAEKAGVPVKAIHCE